MDSRKITEEELEQAAKLYQDHYERMEQYISLLLDWNEKINLVSRMVSRETVRYHVIHSLVPAAMGLLVERPVWIDAGSGGGLPGIPLSIVEEEWNWVLNDNVRKKMKAVSDIVNSLKLTSVQVEAKSISLVEIPVGAGIVSKHAFKIPDLLRLLKGKPWTEIIMWKGAEGGRSELKRAGKGIQATIFEFNVEDPFYEGKAIIRLRNTLNR